MDQTTDTKPFDPKAAGWEPYSDDGFIGLIGPLWQKPAGDSYRYAFLAEHKHHNRRGIVQGGMLMTFADRSMGMTCWYANERQPQATVQLDVHFVDAGEGRRVCRGEVPGRAAHALARVHERRPLGRRPRRRHRQGRVEDAREEVSNGCYCALAPHSPSKTGVNALLLGRGHINARLARGIVAAPALPS
jgi:acyl-coenzyme A thioesterase PaaI-like protein